MTKVMKNTALLLLAGIVSGCGTTMAIEPIGIGGDRDALKQSPCACIEIKQNYATWSLPA